MPFAGGNFSRDRADRAARDRAGGGNGGNLGNRSLGLRGAAAAGNATVADRETATTTIGGAVPAGRQVDAYYDYAKALGDEATKGLFQRGFDFARPFGFGSAPVNPQKPATYAGGTFHTDFNPGAFVGGLASLSGIPGAGILGGFLGGQIYNGLGYSNPVIGGPGSSYYGGAPQQSQPQAPSQVGLGSGFANAGQGGGFANAGQGGGSSNGGNRYGGGGGLFSGQFVNPYQFRQRQSNYALRGI